MTFSSFLHSYTLKFFRHEAYIYFDSIYCCYRRHRATLPQSLTNAVLKQESCHVMCLKQFCFINSLEANTSTSLACHVASFSYSPDHKQYIFASVFTLSCFTVTSSPCCKYYLVSITKWCILYFSLHHLLL